MLIWFKYSNSCIYICLLSIYMLTDTLMLSVCGLTYLYYLSIYSLTERKAQDEKK